MGIGVTGPLGAYVLFLVEEVFRLIPDLVTSLLLQTVVSIALGIPLKQEHAIAGDVQ
jgi:hypothetical protein